MIFVDTAPLVALADPRDTLNVSALRDLGKLARREFVVCQAVLVEACFHLPHRNQRARLWRILDTFSMASYVVADEMRLRTEVFEWLDKYADHEPDWTDGCLAVLSGWERRAKLWTYDAEFRTTWRRPDGTSIPLAVAPSATRAR